MAFIKAITYYLPDKVVTNEQLVTEFPEWSDETAGDMAYKAAEKLIVENDIDRETIDFVLLCTQSPDYFMPSTSCIIQNRLGLLTKCGAFDFNLGCSGYEYGLAVAKSLIVAGIANNILLLTSETYTKHLHPKDKGNRTIFGDGASASLISKDGFAKIGEFILGTDGSGYDRLIRRTGGLRHMQALNDYHQDENDTLVSSDYLYMDGKAIFDFTSDVVPPMVVETLKKNRLVMNDVDLFVFHQANKYMINYLRKLMGIDKDKFYVFMGEVGNTVSSTIPIALCEAQKEGRLKGNVILAGFGVGLSYGATVINI